MKTLTKIGLMGFTSLFLLGVGCQEIVDEAVGKKPEDAKTVNITMIAKSASNPVFISAHIGAMAAAEELTDKHSSLTVHIDWRTPLEENAAEQAERIRNAVEDGTDAIIVSCSDDSILTSAINDAVNHGVPVMTFDSDAPNSKRFAFYGPNDEQIGEKVMKELIGQMGESGKVAILGGSQSAPNIQKRVIGIQKVAQKYPGVEIVGVFFHDETAEAAVAEVLRVNQAYPELTGWAMAGGWPFFSDALIDKIDPEKIEIVAVDALPGQLPYVEKGITSVLLAQPTYRMGKVSVETVIDKIFLNKDVPEMNTMKLIRVSKENLGGWARQLRAWGYENVPVKYLTYVAD